MIYLSISVLSSCLIFIVFKLLGRYKLKIFPAIVINYLTAAFTGYFLSDSQFKLRDILNANWFYVSILLGVLFVVMFYIIGYSTKIAGISITSIGTKMSVVFPMLFSILYFGEKMYALKIVGILLALISIALSSIKGEKNNFNITKLVFPIVLFVGMGLVDSLVKFNQEKYLLDTGALESSTVTFIVSAIISLSAHTIKSKRKEVIPNRKTILLGVILGLANFGSLYFLIVALNSKFMESSVIFAVNNMAIIVLSAFVGKYLFKEKLNLLNWSGVILSLFAILALSF